VVDSMIDLSARMREASALANAGRTRSVHDVLAPYRGARVLCPPHVDGEGRYVGNNGDLLILEGVARLFQSLGLVVVTAEEQADLVVMCGGGGMRERGRWVPGILRDCCRRLGHLPLVVLPSSWEFPTQPLAQVVGGRVAPLTLFAREAYSYLHLREDHQLPRGCSIELDHDIALQLRDAPLLERLRAIAPRSVLIVERTDMEHPEVEGGRRPLKKHRLLKRLIPAALRPLAWRLRAALGGRRETPFRAACEAILQADYPHLARLPRRILDVSHPSAGDLAFFCDEVASAAAVFTTRLHPGILGALLGRPTTLFEGPYHKIRGVYEFSLRGLGDVRLESLHASRA
jgi:exopolysaccharide biosynthesis predicted pyruvyltransferase EpsI